MVIYYTYEAIVKPIICTKQAGEKLASGDIYYRYHGQNTKIKYAELSSILDKERLRVESLWMNLFKETAKIGVDNASLLNISDGKISIDENKNIFLDESLISQMKFIKEGQFSEVDGSPTLKLIGELKSGDATVTSIMKKEVVITEDIGKTHPYNKADTLRELSLGASYINVNNYDRLSALMWKGGFDTQTNLYKPHKNGKSTVHCISEEGVSKLKNMLSDVYTDKGKLVALTAEYRNK